MQALCCSQFYFNDGASQGACANSATCRQVLPLKSAVGDYLLSALDARNLVTLFELADEFDMRRLRSALVAQLALNFDALVDAGGLVSSLAMDVWRDVLRADALSVRERRAARALPAETPAHACRGAPWPCSRVAPPPPRAWRSCLARSFAADQSCGSAPRYAVRPITGVRGAAAGRCSPRRQCWAWCWRARRRVRARGRRRRQLRRCCPACACRSSTYTRWCTAWRRTRC